MTLTTIRNTLTLSSIGRSKQPFNTDPFYGTWSPHGPLRGTLSHGLQINSLPPTPTPTHIHTPSTHMLSSKLSANNPIILDPY